ncbi:hypothetical protein [Nocardioides sp. TF02-7]|uniref:hypothetical protein n=1 Tax=Nocardioides sp. TF02-7 TaxID=2917724 RepID=UPI001F064EA4|nr:hypothetical protein [Nocardioides sp. TF02-7]UMG93800.1 hypothetical protein MF408_06560 [Nocardioides sp. TF02-7]
MHRLGRGLAALAVVPLLLAGCGDDEPSAPGDGQEASAPSGDDGIDYPDEGVDLAHEPDLEGVYADALQVYVDFERGRQLAAREGGANELLTFSAVGAVADRVVAAAERLGDEGATYDGTVVLEVRSAKPRDTVLRLEVCVDGSELDVPAGAPALLGTADRVSQQVTVTNLSGPWRVTKVEPRGSC